MVLQWAGVPVEWAVVLQRSLLVRGKYSWLGQRTQNKRWLGRGAVGAAGSLGNGYTRAGDGGHEKNGKQCGHSFGLQKHPRSRGKRARVVHILNIYWRTSRTRLEAIWQGVKV